MDSAKPTVTEISDSDSQTNAEYSDNDKKDSATDTTTTDAASTDAATTDAATTETSTADTSTTTARDSVADSDSESTPVFDQSQPLQPTADCIHPEVTTDCNNGWCRIPAGCFIFGSVSGEGGVCRARYAEAQVQVTLTRSFEIRQTEVTQTEWRAAGFELPPPLSDTPCGDCPISFVTVYEAMAYCNRLSVNVGLAECYDLSQCTGTVAGGCPNDKIGCRDGTYTCLGKVERYSDPYGCPGYRLPTPPEWEYAARAGTRTANYAGDLDPDIQDECASHPLVDTIAWHCGNTENVQIVGQKLPNGFGLYDMLGNIGEFVASTYHNRSLDEIVGQAGPLVDPAPALEVYDESMNMLLRGSFFVSSPCHCRSSSLFGGVKGRSRGDAYGFRPVRTLEQAAPTKLVLGTEKANTSKKERVVKKPNK